MKKQRNKEIFTEGTFKIYITQEDTLHTSIYSKGNYTTNCSDFYNILEKNKKKFDETWKTLA